MTKKYNTSKFYNIADELRDDCWCYIIIGGRNTGKTYSSLKYCIDKFVDFIFVKRTLEDVKILCAGSRINQKADFDISPFRSINDREGYNIRPAEVIPGVGAFYDCNENNEPEGKPKGFILALSGVTKYKGFDVSSSNEHQYMIFDEFIPNPWDRVNRKEGEQLLSLYKTVSRGREQRGLEELKLICLANATSINNPTMEILEIVDIVAEMQKFGQSIRIIKERGILIHILENNEEFDEIEKASALYRAMYGTNWAEVEFNNKFAYDNFNAVKKVNLKNYKPYCAFKYKKKTYYVYENNDKMAITKAKFKTDEVYDLNVETDVKRFYIEVHRDIFETIINNDCSCCDFTAYNLIVNLKQYFKV